ncbi:MAG: class I SAM-dependent methyltransferase [Terriglobia bacterium]
MRSPTSKSVAECAEPMGSLGATEFYTQHAQPGFIEACYASAPPRIQAALAKEIEWLREKLNGAGRVLELGCGNGRLLAALPDAARHWVGMDFLEAYLHDARAHRRLAPTTGLTAGRARQLPFADSAFDGVVCAQSTLGLLGEEKLAALREAARVTRPGGRLLFVVYSELSMVPRAEWYTEMHRRGMMAPLDWGRSTPDLLLTEDGHASECFRHERLEELFQEAGLKVQLERLGDIYWAATAWLSSRVPIPSGRGICF